ncbi:MAG TPA: 3-hydroxy-5-phosphonooxypentane-2,4-dione thiolase LsrF, partial [Candidatus Sumerlaeota bacterium]|nr:3-hydroxy-5-phosphonooxypentane-2,4-dione thiolase LsrF [Candidatus Sumerlaeota bacterium]
MPEADATQPKRFHPDIPQRSDGYFLKGASSLDWGMKHRMARIFRPDSGRTLMLAIDHGYFQG